MSHLNCIFFWRLVVAEENMNFRSSDYLYGQEKISSIC